MDLKITDSELILLDGKCSEEVQREVDAAKLRIENVSAHPELPEKLAGFIADVISYAIKNGKLRFTHKNITYCKLCGKTSDYQRFKSGQHEGARNYNKRLSFSGFDLSDSFVSMQGHASLGGCNDCFAQLAPTLLAALSKIACEIPERLTGVPSRWIKSPRMKCKQCGWSGHERQMGRLQTLMGDGYFFGQCPNCKAENHLFCTTIESADGFEMIPVDGKS